MEVWKRACRLAVDVCRTLAKSKQYVLKDQMQRAAISAPSNIAEGSERDSKQDFIRFLRTQTYIALKLELLTKDEADSFVNETKEISAMLQGLIRSLSPKLKTEN